MLLSKGLAITGAILLWVSYAATGAMVIYRSDLLPRAMSESVFLQQLGFMLMSMMQG